MQDPQTRGIADRNVPEWADAAYELAALLDVDDLLVFIPGTIAVVCAVLLTGDRALDRVIRIAARSDGSSGTDDG
ncbi:MULTISPECIES: hypothetical protein [Micromonospora]|uniref:Holin n=2 Tax=Micromonospora TaxID=1873 RepID=A0ABX9Y137_MICCH|nr:MULTISPECIES: hypothetical protein [Micromonospora]EWM65011.1 hypothetical protein MCBG_02144 [Micromonospora sp. M42]MBC8990819.1 hypothetical protein [Micromonospora chalcea]MBP1781937.1 hypothetical protein [Micromonospora sp. HB375]MCK1809315.1 hypothetical protein [Micromonospora sp. R42106]MCK1834199.1 hypothetical protein [Micromonospora sp. R42003]